jgi:hypothetical protein
VDIERLTAKYTGVRIGHDALVAHHRRGGIAAAVADGLIRAAHTVDGAEQELARHAAGIDQATAAVTRAITAGPGEGVPSLNRLGELQSRGARFDALIAVRAACIDHLTELVRLWQYLPTDGDTPTAA